MVAARWLWVAVLSVVVGSLAAGCSCSTGGSRRDAGGGGGDDTGNGDVDGGTDDTGTPGDDAWTDIDAWSDIDAWADDTGIPADDAWAPDIDAWLPPAPDAARPTNVLTVTPADQVLTLALGASMVVHYQAFDSFGTNVTASCTWTVDDAPLGSFSGSDFTTSTTRGGISHVTATMGVASGSTSIEVDRTTDAVILPGAPAGAAGLFGGAPTGGAITWVYPSDQTIVPPNLPSFEVHFMPGAGQTLFDLAFTGGATVHVYAPCTSVGGGCVITLDALTFTEAAIAARATGTVTMTIRGTNGSGGAVGTSPARTLGITPTPLLGGIYYWAAGSGSILRYEFGRSGATPETFLTGNPLMCVGCHTLSRDGTRIAAGHFIPGPATTQIQDVASLANVGASFGSNFGSFSPDTTRFLSSDGAHLSLVNTATGTAATGLPAGTVGSMPDWSADGMRAVFARPSSVPPIGGSPGHTGRADLRVMPWTGSAFGAATTLVTSSGENNYYPSFSPDNAWVLFNRSPDDSYNNIAAHLWAVRADGSGAPVQLTSADGTGDLGNSWPKWAPFVQTYQGQPLMWITVASRRDYGLRLQQQTVAADMRTAQIWMAAFRPNRPGDPTAPSFWMPIQSLSSGNHIAQWAQQIVRHPCGRGPDCRTGERCVQGMCVGM